MPRTDHGSGFEQEGDGCATSAARPIGNEHDEDEMEVTQPSDQVRSGKPVCSQCAGEMEGIRENWFSALTTRFMLKAAAAVLVTIDRSGQPILIQIQKALADPDFKPAYGPSSPLDSLGIWYF